MITAAEIKQAALQLGFDACGIAQAGNLPDDAAYLQTWLAGNFNGEMSYMERYADKRVNPQLLFAGAQSVIVVLLNYAPPHTLNPMQPQIAKYAYGTDYHFVIKEKLRQLQQFIDTRATQQCQICCDSAPVLERRWAERAGLGWIGKSGLLINPTLGSYTLIGELITTLPFDYDQPIGNRCGSCTKCMDACPTKALVEAYRCDARKCISYLTIEKHTLLTDVEKAQCGRHLFGCDACLDACPWNKRAQPHHTPALLPSSDFFDLDWSQLSASQFKKRFSHSPLRRAGFKKIKEMADFILNETRH
ncbi:MAG: tRNA epoxyqueuosine(34) reductase QueG [Paludibacteraceae bacterium]